jgi:hypothetical protein
VAGRIRSIEKSNDIIGDRTRDLLACSIAPQTTTLPRASIIGDRNFRHKNRLLCNLLFVNRSERSHTMQLDENYAARRAPITGPKGKRGGASILVVRHPRAQC